MSGNTITSQEGERSEAGQSNGISATLSEAARSYSGNDEDRLNIGKIYEQIYGGSDAAPKEELLSVRTYNSVTALATVLQEWYALAGDVQPPHPSRDEINKKMADQSNRLYAAMLVEVEEGSAERRLLESALKSASTLDGETEQEVVSSAHKSVNTARDKAIAELRQAKENATKSLTNKEVQYRELEERMSRVIEDREAEDGTIPKVSELEAETRRYVELSQQVLPLLVNSDLSDQQLSQEIDLKIQDIALMPTVPEGTSPLDTRKLLLNYISRVGLELDDITSKLESDKISWTGSNIRDAITQHRSQSQLPGLQDIWGVISAYETSKALFDSRISDETSVLQEILVELGLSREDVHGLTVGNLAALDGWITSLGGMEISAPDPVHVNRILESRRQLNTFASDQQVVSETKVAGVEEKEQQIAHLAYDALVAVEKDLELKEKVARQEAANADLQRQILELQAQLAASTAQIADQEETIANLTARLETLQSAPAVVNGQVTPDASSVTTTVTAGELTQDEEAALQDLKARMENLGINTLTAPVTPFVDVIKLLGRRSEPLYVVLSSNGNSVQIDLVKVAKFVDRIVSNDRVNLSNYVGQYSIQSKQIVQSLIGDQELYTIQGSEGYNPPQIYTFVYYLIQGYAKRVGKI
ncbi:MAG: hypothetical protein QY318_03865 [Candidatus Dojkabacteria bacterium]|nr:MAG: hypothetical protein QY318_03865 [Candidatus Dojkabacteria bacterium]